MFQGAYIVNLVRYKSDHATIMLHDEELPITKIVSGGGSFKFETSWLLDEGV